MERNWEVSMKSSLITAMAVAAGLLWSSADAAAAKDYRFVIVPKVVHPWFDLVHDGAKDAAGYLKKAANANVTVDYIAPQQANVVEQNQIIERAIATHPDGIALDLPDAAANNPILEEAMQAGIKVVAFDSVPPDG